MSKLMELPLIGILLLEATDWSNLSHQKGYATDTPGHLRALMGTDAALQRAALNHISTCMGRTLVWPATPVAAAVVFGMLLDRSLEETIDPIRKELEAFILRVLKFGELVLYSDLLRDPDKNFETIQKHYWESVQSSSDKAIEFRLQLFAHSVASCFDFSLKMMTTFLNRLACAEEHPIFNLAGFYSVSNETLTRNEASQSELFLSSSDTESMEYL